MSKYMLLMLRDKDCNGATYSLPSTLVSSKLDPSLHVKLAALDHKFHSTVEEAESAAKSIANDIFVYDHTKRPKVLKDFRLYRWWILDVEKPVQVWCGCYHYGSDELDRGEFKTLAELYPSVCCYGVKDAIAKKGKLDFSKAKDPSNGTIAKRAKTEHDRVEKSIKEWWADPKRYLDTFFDDPFNRQNDRALDMIPYSSKWIKGFHKDSLNLLSEYCLVYPTKGCRYGEAAAKVVGADPSSRKKVWACSVSRCVYEKEAHWKDHCSEMYKATTKIFPTKEEALLNATVLGFAQPQVFEDFKLPDYVTALLGYIEGVGGSLRFPAEIYRVMVIDGVMQPIKKFMKKKVAKA